MKGGRRKVVTIGPALVLLLSEANRPPGVPFCLGNVPIPLSLGESAATSSV